MTDEANSDEEILFPDLVVEIDGEQVEVREFRYLDGLKATAIARPIIAGYRRLLDEQGEAFEPEALDEVIGEHAEAWTELLAISTGRDAAWVRSLSDGEGVALSLAFWEANGPFFVRRLMLSAAAARKIRADNERSRSEKSSAPSSEPDTDGTTKA